jgi:hypothetical protein
MKKHKSWAVGIVLAGLLLMLQVPPQVAAQESPPQHQEPQEQDQAPPQDPPGRVARLHESIGSVSFQPGGEGDWVQAVPNRPLTTFDNIWADKDSRAELQMGSASVRMDSETSLTFLDLDDFTTQLKLSQGSIVVRVRHLDDDDHFEVDTPNSAFVIQHTGEYRIDVNAAGSETDVTVWQGRGEITGGGSSYLVVAGQRARFTGADQLDHEIDQIPGRDDFDEWAFDRDQHQDRADSSNYVSPEMTGADDLDEYGQWNYVAEYGPVWTPVGVEVGWSPYRNGHWGWIGPWGWTWVEEEPWGFAPFHYGRWAFAGGVWCWVPGPVVVRPVYMPALVAFVGGGGFSFGAGISAGVAWFPLAPREVFIPWYHTSSRYVNKVNITNTRVSVTQVTNVYSATIINNRTTNITYINQRMPNGVTAVSRETFLNARPVATNIVRVAPEVLASAPVTHNIPAQPVKTSALGAGRSTAARPPVSVMNRQVVATRTPFPPPASFEQRQASMNVHAETPEKPQPAVQTEAEPARPAANPHLTEQGTPPRPQEAAPQPAVRPAEASVPRPKQPAENGRTVMDSAHSEASVPRPKQPAENGRTVMDSPHSLVRQAPPVQERPELQRSEEQKFNAWQQQRPKPAPAPRPPAQAAEPQHPHK